MSRISILILALLGMCRAGEVLAQTTPEEGAYAVLFIYQKGAFGNGTYKVWINGQLIADNFQPRSYFVINVPPGTLQLRTTGRPTYLVEEKTFRLQVQARQEYYLEAVLDYDFLSRSLYLEQRNAEDFRKRLKGLKRDDKAKTKLD